MGGRRTEDKSAFLARAKTERLARELERKRAVAAGLVQRWWRGRRESMRTREMFRVGWDEDMGKLQQVLATFAAAGIPFAAPLASVSHFTRQFLFFHRLSCRSDAARAGTLAALLVPACVATDPATSFLADAFRADTVRTWAQRVSNLLAVVLMRLKAEETTQRQHSDGGGAAGSGGGEQHLTAQGSAALTELAELLTQPEKWPLVKSGVSSKESAAAAMRHALLLLAKGDTSARSTSSSLFDALRSSSSSPNSTVVQALAIRLTLQALGVSAIDNAQVSSEDKYDEPSSSLGRLETEAFSSFRSCVLEDPLLCATPSLFTPLQAAFAGEDGTVADAWWQLVKGGLSKGANEGGASLGQDGGGGGTGYPQVSSESTATSQLERDREARASHVVVANLLALVGSKLGKQPSSVSGAPPHSLSVLPPPRMAMLVRLVKTYVVGQERMMAPNNGGDFFDDAPGDPSQTPPSSGGGGGGALALAAHARDEDEEDDEDDDRAESNGIKGLEFFVLQERRRRHLGQTPPPSLLSSSLSSSSSSRCAACSVVNEVLSSSRLVAYLFDSVLPPAAPPPAAAAAGASAGTSASSDATELCCAYGRLLAHCAPASTTSNSKGAARVLDTLASAKKVPHFLPRLWAALRSHCPSVSYSPGPPLSSSAAATSASSSSQASHVTLVGAPRELADSLFLFAKVYSRLLVSLNDDEFFELGLPLPLNDQVSVSSMLGDHLYDMLWAFPVVDIPTNATTASASSAASSSPPPPRGGCLGCWYGDNQDGGGGDGVGDSSSSSSSSSRRLCALQHLLVNVRLFNQLYDRHARREFKAVKGAGREHWHWAPARGSELALAFGGGGFASAGSRKSSLVLTCIPQVVPFEQRVGLFYNLIEGDKEANGFGDRSFMQGQVVDLTVSRDTIYDDAMAVLNRLGPSLKARVRVTYASDLGYTEAGIDGGGLFRDFMDHLTTTAFAPEKGFFSTTSDLLLYPSPSNRSVADFEFLGRVLGKAVYSNILVKPQFALTFLNKLLDRTTVIDDLYTLDPELYRHLMGLKSLVSKDDQAKPLPSSSSPSTPLAASSSANTLLDDLSLTFTVGVLDSTGRPREQELFAGGSQVAVTKSNFLSYLYRVADFKLNREIAGQAKAFLRGFHDLIPVDWIRMFDARELQMLISGDDQGMNIEDMQKYTNYAGGYHESQPIMQWFWEILAEFTPAQQADFLAFITACPRQPLLGFQFLEPLLCVQKVPLDETGEKLPTAATCMNLLKLPDYPNKATMHRKLLYAISANAGFELS